MPKGPRGESRPADVIGHMLEAAAGRTGLAGSWPRSRPPAQMHLVPAPGSHHPIV